MSLLPDSATFHEQVEACFVAYRGHGVSLSAVDVDLVDGWAQRGVPIEVIARGIRKAAEAALFDAPDGQGRLRSLKGARKAVEAEIDKYLKRAAGRTETSGDEPVEPFEVTRHKRLAAALKKLLKAHPGLERVVAHLLSLDVPHDFAAADRREALTLGLLLRALPFERRLAIAREASRLVAEAAPSTAAARRESLQFHRAALTRQAWELPAFW